VLPDLGKFTHFGEILGSSGEFFSPFREIPKVGKIWGNLRMSNFFDFYVVNEKNLHKTNCFQNYFMIGKKVFKVLDNSERPKIAILCCSNVF
jgi:hypothetical protein